MKQRQITLRTLPNGYILKVNANEYVYFNEKELVTGFLFHVGYNEPEASEIQSMQEIIDASVVWKDTKKSAKEIISLTEKNAALTRANKNLKTENERLTKKLKKLCGDENKDEQ